MQFALRALAARVHRAAVDVHSLGSCSLFSFRSPMANDPRSPPARSPERGSLAWLSHHSHLLCMRAHGHCSAFGLCWPARRAHRRGLRAFRSMHWVRAAGWRERSPSPPAIDRASPPDGAAAPVAVLDVTPSNAMPGGSSERGRCTSSPLCSRRSRRRRDDEEGLHYPFPGAQFGRMTR